MHISDLYIYPVKGLAAVAVGAARLDAFGLEHDRRFMVVDEHGQFVSQRECGALALISATIAGGVLALRTRTATVAVPARPHAGERVRVRIWHDDVDAIDCGRDAAAFLTQHVGSSARLVFMPDDTLRQVDEKYARAGDRVSFADAFPLLLITQESLDGLNHRLSEPVPMLRFRPNIVVTGATPHAEDSWREIRIADIPCDVVKPCARCVVTTIDPATGIAGREPLRTLGGYRRMNGKVYFGQNVVQRASGVIRVGDRVEVVSSGTARPDVSLTV